MNMAEISTIQWISTLMVEVYHDEWDGLERYFNDIIQADVFPLLYEYTDNTTVIAMLDDFHCSVLEHEFDGADGRLDDRELFDFLTTYLLPDIVTVLEGGELL